MENINHLSSQELDTLARSLPLVREWLAAVEWELLNRLSEGAEFSSVRLEPKQAQRKWKKGVDMIPVLSALGELDVVAPRAPLSPAQAQKVLRTQFVELAEYVVQESSGLKLVYSGTTETPEN